MREKLYSISEDFDEILEFITDSDIGEVENFLKTAQEGGVNLSLYNSDDRFLGIYILDYLDKFILLHNYYPELFKENAGQLYYEALVNKKKEVIEFLINHP